MTRLAGVVLWLWTFSILAAGIEDELRLTNVVFQATTHPNTNLSDWHTNGATVWATNTTDFYSLTASNFPTLNQEWTILQPAPFLSSFTGPIFHRVDPDVSNWQIGVSAFDTNLNVMRVAAGPLNAPPHEKFSLIAYQSNSIPEVHRQSMSNLFSGVASNGITSPYWTTMDAAATNYVRNPACILAGLDLTGISPMRISGGLGNGWCSAAIGRRYISGATHVGWWPGMQVVFFDASNAPVIRTLVTNYAIADDLTIGVLDSDLPASIRHFKVWPDEGIWMIFPYIPDFGNVRWKGSGAPCFGINQHGNTYVIDHQPQAQLLNNFASFGSSLWYPDWSYSIHGGDSSTPVFSVLGTNMVYWGAWWTAGGFNITGSGNTAAIVAATGTNFLEAVDLSPYTFPGVTSADTMDGTTDPTQDPGINSMIYVNRTTGSLWHWSAAKTNWLKLIGP